MEKFKKIKDYPNYLISDQGRVYSCKRKKFLKPANNGRGYFIVDLSKNGIRKNLTIHRLVALAFIPNPENKRTINHIDGIKTNNHADNLEWCSQKENVHHAVNAGLKDDRGSKHGMAKLTEDQVLEIRRLYKTGNYIYKDLGEMFGVHYTLIGYIVNRKIWKHM